MRRAAARDREPGRSGECRCGGRRRRCAAGDRQRRPVAPRLQRAVARRLLWRSRPAPDGTRRSTRISHGRGLVSRDTRERGTPRGRRVRGDPSDHRSNGAHSRPANRAGRRRRGRVDASVQGGPLVDVQATGISFVAPPGERYLGFGERSNAVDQRGNEVENYVAEGPYQEVERPFIAAFVPPPGYHPRDDATYFPIPWLLSTRGFGVLVANDETSVFRLGTDQRRRVVGRGRRRRACACASSPGPRPARRAARASARASAASRRPRRRSSSARGGSPRATRQATSRRCKAAGALGSVVQTYTHYLPCGDQVEADRERERTARFHAAGLAVTTYFNPMICTDYTRATRRRGTRGRPDEQRARPAVRVPLHGRVAVLRRPVRLHPPGRRRFYGDLLDEAVARRLRRLDGGLRRVHAARRARRRRLDRRGVPQPLRRRLPRRRARLRARSRATAARALQPLRLDGRGAQYSQIVWGGDPTTGWGFDGLESAVSNGLTMGLSGRQPVGLGHRRLLRAVGAADDARAARALDRVRLRVGRDAHAGQRLRSSQPSTRAQIFDTDMLPIWARYAKLRTQLYPVPGGGRRRSTTARGMPLMRHLALAYPDDATRDRARRRVPARPRPARRAGHAARRARARRSTCRRAAGSTCGGRSTLDDARRAAPRRAAGARRRARCDAARPARRAAAARPRRARSSRCCSRPSRR